jgi:predicted phosphodiesterase
MKKAKKKSQKDIRRELIEKFSEAILEASQTYGVDTSFVTKAQFDEFSGLSEWDLRKLGGFANIKKSVFPFEGDQDLASISQLKKAKNYIAKLERELGDKQTLENEIKKAVCGKIKPVRVTPYRKKKTRIKVKKDIVAMLNDSHVGLKVAPEEVDNLNSFDFTIASRRIAFFIDEVCNYKRDKRDEIGTLHLVLNGDLIAGIIHGLMSNDLELLTHQVNGAVHIFTNAVARVSENYNNVKVYFSTGNHGDSPHRREGGRVTAQVYDSIEGQIFYAVSAAHKATKNVEFLAGKSLSQDIKLPAGRAIATHGHIMFSKQLGSPGTSVNTKLLGQAVSDLNESERRAGRDEVKLVLLGHTHCHFDITAKNGARIINAPSLSGIDSYAFGIGIRQNLTAQIIFESTADYIVGDSRLIYVSEADNNKEMDKVIKPYDYELVYVK